MTDSSNGSDDLVITSPANPRLKAVAALRRRGTREDTGVTLLEGYEELVLALDSGLVPRSLYHCPELMAHPEAQAETVHRVNALGAEVVQLGRVAFERAAYREGPDGFLAVVPSVSGGCADLVVPDDAMLLMCERVEKPGNLGAMLRTADAAGVHAVIAADPVTDWGNPNLIRSAKGTVFSVPVAADPTPVALDWLASHGIPVVAATPDSTTDHTDISYAGPVAIAVGAENQGLSEQMLAAATHRVRIPMVGRANSLNVATSAGILLYEAVRQRRGGAR